jgi:hypothetical protein
MSEYRDTHKTAGAIRAAAFDLCQQLKHTHRHDDAAELHDSIAKALPLNPETPAAVSRAAAELLGALELADKLLGELQVHNLDDADSLNTLALINNAIELAYGGTDFNCTSCNRPEEECSADPCEAVLKERES